MAEMAAAAAAMGLGAQHAVGAVLVGFDRSRLWIVKARPASAALEFARGLEQRLATARACERAGPFLVIQCAAAWRLGAMAAHHVVLLRAEQAPPFGVGVGDRECVGRRHNECPRRPMPRWSLLGKWRSVSATLALVNMRGNRFFIAAYLRPRRPERRALSAIWCRVS